MSGTYLFVGILIAAFILLLSFVDLLMLIIKKRLPMKGGIEKEWKSRGIIRTEKRLHLAAIKQKQFQLKDIIHILVVGIALFFVSYLFFQNMFFALLFSGLSVFYPNLQRKRVKQKRKTIFLNQFRDAMYSISISLKAGSSLQVALKRCEEDLQKGHITQKEKPMLEEISQINHDIEFGISIDQALSHFKERMDLEDVTQFVDSILITRTKGGNLTKVTQNTAERIADKISIQQEIQLATAQKRSEAKVLTFFPIVIVLLLVIVNPEYMEPMYNTWIGNFLLFLAAVMLVANYFVGKKVANIDV